MDALILQLLIHFSPIIADVIKNFRAKHGRDPNDAEMKIELEGNVDKYLGKGSAWRLAHPGA